MLSSYTWSKHEANGQRRWSRQLGGHEAAFYWDSELNGACDVLSNTHIALDASRADILSSIEKIKYVWRAVKYRHPLLAASVIEDGSLQHLQFCIKEERVAGFYPGEVQLRIAETMDEYAQICNHYDYGPRMLSAEFLSRLVVVGIPNPAGDTRSHYHIFIATSHAITDAVALFNVTRTFFDMLTSKTLFEFDSDITRRLTMVPAIDHLYIDQKISPVQHRWRRAVAQLIMQRRMNKLQGGCIIPNHVTTETLFKPAYGRRHMIQLGSEETRTLLAGCRAQGITFGHAFHVLCQLANASIIRDVPFSEREWEYRRRQPSHFFSPLNIRPFVNKEWLRQGGTSEAVSTGSIYQCTLPFLPLESPRHEMLSRKRFFYRCRLVKKEMALQLKHPLILEFAALNSAAHEAERSRFTKLWRERQRNPGFIQVDSKSEDEKFTSASQVSSFGAIDDGILPRMYPRNSKRPFLTAISNATWARAFPGQFYTTAYTWEGKLQIASLWDGNAYDDEMILRWMNNLARYTREYLLDPPIDIVARARL